MLGVEETDNNELNVEKLPRHRDEDQVALDVNRSFVYYPEGSVAPGSTSADRGTSLTCARGVGDD